MVPGRINLSVKDARELGEGALRGVGYTDDEARIIADHCIDAALCGYEYSGLAKILNVPESASFNSHAGRHIARRSERSGRNIPRVRSRPRTC